MKEEWEITQEAFDRFLAWLHSDRSLAGEKYEVIRRGLNQFFTGRGCADAEHLTDDTITRVIKNLPRIAGEYTGEQARYFYGVARLVFHEYLRRPPPPPPVLHHPSAHAAARDQRLRCLDHCLDELPADDRLLMLEYYQKDKQERIDHRNELADRLGLTLNHLRVRGSRLRDRLHRCIEECLKK